MISFIKERMDLLKTEQSKMIKHVHRVIVLEKKRIIKWKHRGQEDIRKVFIGEEEK